jgi:hypothetical protein
MVFQGEAEVRWLDHCEASLARFALTNRAATRPATRRTTKDTTTETSAR